MLKNPRVDPNLPKSAGRRSSNGGAGRQREEIPSGGAPLSRLRPPCRAVQRRAVPCRGWTPALSAARCCSAVASWKKRAGSLALPNPKTNGGGGKKKKTRVRGEHGTEPPRLYLHRGASITRTPLSRGYHVLQKCDKPQQLRV